MKRILKRKKKKIKKSESILKTIGKVIVIIFGILLMIPIAIFESLKVDRKNKKEENNLKKSLDKNPEIKKSLVSIAKNMQNALKDSLDLSSDFKKYFKYSSISESSIQYYGGNIPFGKKSSSCVGLILGCTDLKMLRKDTGLTDDIEFDDWVKSTGDWVWNGESEIMNTVNAINKNLKKDKKSNFMSIDYSLLYGEEHYYDYNHEDVILFINIDSMTDIAQKIKRNK